MPPPRAFQEAGDPLLDALPALRLWEHEEDTRCSLVEPYGDGLGPIQPVPEQRGGVPYQVACADVTLMLVDDKALATIPERPQVIHTGFAEAVRLATQDEMERLDYQVEYPLRDV